jgi:hypothetical protein
LGVIVDSARKGEYSPSTTVPVVDSRLAAWLLESAVVSTPDGVTDFHSLVNGPCLFPFQIGRMAPERLAESGRLEVVRHGLEETIVRVRNPLKNRGAQISTSL